MDLSLEKDQTIKQQMKVVIRFICSRLLVIRKTAVTKEVSVSPPRDKIFPSFVVTYILIEVHPILFGLPLRHHLLLHFFLVLDALNEVS